MPAGAERRRHLSRHAVGARRRAGDLRHGATGQGQFVDVAMYDGVLALCERIVYQYSYTGEIPRPRGNGQPNLCPFDVFPAADGHVTIAAPTADHWRSLCEIIGRPELGLDDRDKNNYARIEHRARGYEGFLVDWTKPRTKAQIVSKRSVASARRAR